MSRTTVKLSARDYNRAISPDKLNAQAQLTNKNIIINGGMTVAQRGTSATGITSSDYRTVDRFRPSMGTVGTWTITQATDVPTGQGFANSLKFDCTTANGSLSAGSDMALQYRIEGQNLQMLKKGTANAQSLTLSFWVKSTKTGTFICELQDNDNSRNISKAYTVSTTNTWEKKELTFAGDTTGTFGNDNAKSMTIMWWQSAGTTYTSGTLATSWVSPTNANRAVGQVNIADSTANDWLITGVQMEIGDKATDFEYEPYNVTYKKCLRYYQKITGTTGTNHYLGTLQAYSSANVFGLIAPYLAPLRVAKPAVGQSGTFEFSQTGSSDTGSATIANLAASDFGWMTGGWGGGTLTAGYASSCRATENAYLTADAEL